MWKLLLVGLLAVYVVPPAKAQERAYDSTLEARVWLDRADEPVLRRGDRVKVYYRTSLDAHIAIFRIDTDGRITLVQPAHPGAEELTRGGQDYRLAFPNSAQWIVTEDPGIGYYFILAAEQPLDFSRFAFVPEEDRWDLTSVGETVYEDPYVAIDAYVALLIADWEVAAYALDFIEYSVGEAHSYPRFLCYDCHGSRTYASWNPYSYVCTDFRVVLWDDPYYHPAYRYAGTRVVFPRPLQARPRYTLAARAPGEGWSPLVRRRQAPPLPRRVTQFKERDVASAPRSAEPGRRPATSTSSSASPRRPAGAAASARPTSKRRLPVTDTRRAVPRGSKASPRSDARAGASRIPTRAGSSTRVVAPRRTRTQVGGAAPRKAPTVRRSPTRASRPTASSSRPSASRARPSTGGARPTAPRPTTGRARPTPPRPTVGRARPTPARPTAGRARPTSARPTAYRTRPTPARPTTRAAPARRPTVRARPKPPPRRGGRGG